MVLKESVSFGVFVLLSMIVFVCFRCCMIVVLVGGVWLCWLWVLLVVMKLVVLSEFLIVMGMLCSGFVVLLCVMRLLVCCVCVMVDFGLVCMMVLSE